MIALTVIACSPLIAVEPTASKSPTPGTPAPAPTLQKKVDFESHVLPIFKRNCLACHNATDAEGDLVLETPATIMKGGESGSVVVCKRSTSTRPMGLGTTATSSPGSLAER